MQASGLHFRYGKAYHRHPIEIGKRLMGINSESDLSADLQIGPTTTGGVRIFVKTERFEVPMDFEPEEAEEIAEELRAAAALARKQGKKSKRG